MGKNLQGRSFEQREYLGFELITPKLQFSLVRLILILKINNQRRRWLELESEKGSTRICIFIQAQVTQKVISRLKF